MSAGKHSAEGQTAEVTRVNIGLLSAALRLVTRYLPWLPGDFGIVGRWRAVCVTALQRPNSDAAAIDIVVGIAAASLSVKSVFTRMAVVKALDKIKDNDFCNHFPWPPSSPKTTCQVVDIQCNHASVFVAGRYNKYSRTLPQTPWVIDGERKMESSVEELITEPLMAVFKADSFNFSSSGREDVDVRTLGRGRPFAIELVNPHRVRLAEKDMRDLQQKINNNDKIKVRDLQIVSREALAHMKEGEEEKTKCYSALIWTERTIEKEDLEFLNDLKELKLIQKTPLRVLHRRPLASRSRIIHTMKTEYMDEHHFRLYIKEFAHGDFGRTVPNIGSMMKTTADILELDVESVDVDWPPALED
ncbi:unnamed protein product [Ranitomeya imitator]|uniref:tRNA pseudouridine(55) synthase n=1 Tax=Ranitomeya imitator TaxID=111125 RepID=A0ABN9L796_9NEOB|nr:unnamed protein product [Ranitomeya imitator]